MEQLTDLVRLTVPVAFALLAIDDYHTRRIPSSSWVSLVAVAAVLLAFEGGTVLFHPDVSAVAYGVRVAVSVVAVGGLGFALLAVGAFGLADAKALLVVSLLLPTTPGYSTPLGTLPVAAPPLGVLSLAVVSNAILIAGAYPLLLATRNALAGRFSRRMFTARPASTAELPELHGDVHGLDLDILRAYLDWSDTTAVELERVGEDRAAAFLDELEGPRYGTTATDLRDGVNAIAENSRVWVTPGIPFLVPIFFGIVTAFTVGDLFALLG